MAMKNGDKTIFIVSMFFLGTFLGRNKSKKNLKQKTLNPTTNQYLNRLIEFYDSSEMNIIENEFFSLVDFGMSPEYAFMALIKNGEKND